MTDGSGKIGGNVAGKNRFGNYLRRKGQTLNPQTIAQQIIRNLFGVLSSAWRSLTEVQRAGWINITPLLQVFDQFGDAVTLTGAQMFNRINLNLLKIGQAVTLDAPAPEGTAAIIDFVADVDNGPGATNNLSLNLDRMFVAPGPVVSIMIESTGGVSPGLSEGSIKNKFRVIKFGAPAFTGISTSGTSSDNSDYTTGGSMAEAFANLFGEPAVGDKVFFRATMVNEDTGETSPPVITSTIVINTP